MATGASLVAVLGLDSAKFNKGLKQSQGRVSKFSKGASQGFSKLKGAFIGLTAALGTKALLENADTLVKNADAAGFGFEEFQKLQHGMEQSGISAEAFAKSTVRVNKVLLDAERGSKTAKDSLAGIGLSFRDLEKLSPEDRYKAVVAALNSVDDAGRRQALSNELLGRSFGAVRVDIDSVIKEGNKLVPITEENARSAEQSNDSFNLLSKSLSNLSLNVLAPLIKNVTPVIEAFAAFAKEHPGLTKLGVALTAVGVAIKLIGGPITIVTTAIGVAILAWKNWDKIVAKFQETFPKVSAAIRTVFQAFKDFSISKIVNSIKAGVLKVIISLVSTIEKIIRKIPLIGEKNANAFRDKFLAPLNEAYEEAVGNSIIPDMVDAIEREMDRMGGIGKASSEAFRDNLNTGLTDALKGNGSVKDIMNSFLDDITNTVISRFSTGLSEGIADLVEEGVTKLATSIASGVGGSGGGFGSLISAGINFLGFNQGGVVPNIPGSNPNKDSVPALLTPGEEVIPKGGSGSGKNITINMAVTGNVDDAVKRTVLTMGSELGDIVYRDLEEKGRT